MVHSLFRIALMGGPVPHERAAAMLHALRSLFVVTSGIAVAIVLFAGCEPVLPEDTSTDAGHVESYVGSYIAVGRSVEVTLDVNRDEFTMVTFDVGSDRAQVSDRRFARARGGPAWYIVDGSVSELDEAVQFEVTGIEINRSSSDPSCSPILVTKDASFHDAAIESLLLDCLGIDQSITAERLDPPSLAVGAWEIPYSPGRPRTVEYSWTIHRDGTAVLRNTYTTDPQIDFLEFTLGIVFTNTTLTLQPITSIRGVLKDGTEADGESYLDYYNEQIAVYENIIIHYTVTDEFMTWDYEVLGTNPFAESVQGMRFVRIN